MLRWRGPRRIINARNDYAYKVEDLRNAQLEDIHASRLEFYRDGFLNSTAVMSHVLQLETVMPVARVMVLEETPDGLPVYVGWKGLESTEDTLEPLGQVKEEVP